MPEMCEICGTWAREAANDCPDHHPNCTLVVRPTTFRSKPKTVKATQWFPGRAVAGVSSGVEGECGPSVRTAHGQRAFLAPGDWVIEEPDGRGYYPCKPDIFAKSYEPVE